MLSWIVLIVVVAVVCLLGIFTSTQLFGRGEAVPPLGESAEVDAANRSAIDEGNIDALQFEVVHRGYNMAQVDALISYLLERQVGPELPTGLPTTSETGVESGFTSATEGEVAHGSNETPYR